VLHLSITYIFSGIGVIGLGRFSYEGLVQVKNSENLAHRELVRQMIAIHMSRDSLRRERSRDELRLERIRWTTKPGLSSMAVPVVGSQKNKQTITRSQTWTTD